MVDYKTWFSIWISNMAMWTVQCGHSPHLFDMNINRLFAANVIVFEWYQMVWKQSMQFGVGEEGLYIKPTPKLHSTSAFIKISYSFPNYVMLSHPLCPGLDSWDFLVMQCQQSLLFEWATADDLLSKSVMTIRPAVNMLRMRSGHCLL